MTRTVVFRADASADIGSGHVMRCLTLAHSLRALGAHCLFVCRELPGHLCQRIESRGFSVLRLPSLPAESDRSYGAAPNSHWLGVTQDRDADETMAEMSRRQVSPDWIVVDHYGIDRLWERRVRSSAKALMVIDDLADRHHDCDLLVDQNLVADFERRYDRLTQDRCLRLLGPHYALLQEDYSARPSNKVQTAEDSERRVLVYFGGTDKRRLTIATVRALMALESKALSVDVVIDRTSDQYPELMQISTTQHNLIVHAELPSLEPLLASAAIAIGASGASSWERLYFGVPSIVVPIAENQQPIARELERRGYAIVVGEHDLHGGGFGALVDRCFAARERDKLATAKGLVDGRGSERVAVSLCAQPDMPLVMRPAKASDEAILLVWANDPETRRNAFTSGTILPDIHGAWFARKLASPADCRIFILETKTGLPIGQIRFDRVDSKWTIGYSLAPHMRGRGVGARLLDLGLTALSDAVGRCRVIGLVKAENLPSRRAFLRCGFVETFIQEKGHFEFRQE